MGLYLDQLVRRVDTQHRDMAGFFADEIARPYGMIGDPYYYYTDVLIIKSETENDFFSFMESVTCQSNNLQNILLKKCDYWNMYSNCS